MWPDDTSRDGSVDPANPNNSQTQVVALVGADQTVLDIGCGTGEVARALTDAGCVVTGLDGSDGVDESNRGLLKDLVVADLGSTRLSSLFDPGAFDVVVLDTVLHQLADPATVVADARDLLAAGGSIVVNAPNPTHAAARLAVLRGDHAPEHLHAFTGDDLCGLLEDAGLAVEVFQATMLDPLDPMVTEATVVPQELPPGVVEWVRHQPRALCFQYVVRARPVAAGTESPPRPALEPLVAPSLTRRSDEFTQQRRDQQEQDHGELHRRDHIMGLEARAANAVSKQRFAEERALRLEARAKRLKRQLLDLAAAVDKMPRGRGQRRARELADEVRPGRGGDD
jgi:SAM-dependent methyltransferase